MSEHAASDLKWIGKSIPRKEDPKLLTGRAQYVDDVNLPRMAHAALLLSPHAHARIVAIDTSRAEALPGVLAVVTGAQAARQTGPLPTLSQPAVLQYCLAVGKVRYAGEPMVAVVAENRYIAEDALELIEVEFAVLPAVPDMDSALASHGDSVLHPELGDSNIMAHVVRKWGGVDALFAGAERVVKRRFRWPRVSAQPIETVGAVADYDPVTKKFSVYSNMSQQMALSPRIAQTLGVTPSQLNFHPMYVGGSFGGKVSVFYAMVLAATLSRIVGRPVKYMEDRLEHLLNGNQHGSDRRYEAEMALDGDGLMLALRFKIVDDYGAYMQMGLGSHGNALAQATGAYRIAGLHYEVTAVATNKTQQGPYRGFGGEVGNFVLERLVDAAASELGIDPVQLRRKNFITQEQFPYKIPNGNVYDSGNYQAVLDKALDEARLDQWRARQALASGSDKRIGIGVATVCERSVLSVTEFWFLNDKPALRITSSPESVQVRIDAAGMAIVTIYAPCWGNSPETMAAQFVAEHLCMHPDQVSVVYASTDLGQISKGPAGSRYTAMLAGAVEGACKILRTKLLALGSHMLGVASEDAALTEAGVVSLASPQRAVALADVARAAHLFRLDFPEGELYSTGLVASYTYDHPFTTLPNPETGDLGVFYPIVGHACHIVVVEVDVVIGTVKILDYVAVHDVGRVVNPMTMDGQIRGGIAQGIGTVFYEKYQYDADGQALTGSLADYLVPTACEIPDIRVAHVETPSPFTSFGIKGGGEGGRLAACPAIVAAVENALQDFDVYLGELPLTPAYLHALLLEKNG
jgi:CO/xanthine dehydrogenase Mo-binding subunit